MPSPVSNGSSAPGQLPAITAPQAPPQPPSRQFQSELDTHKAGYAATSDVTSGRADTSDAPKSADIGLAAYTPVTPPSPLGSEQPGLVVTPWGDGAAPTAGITETGSGVRSQIAEKGGHPAASAKPGDVEALQKNGDQRMVSPGAPTTVQIAAPGGSPQIELDDKGEQKEEAAPDAILPSAQIDPAATNLFSVAATITQPHSSAQIPAEPRPPEAPASGIASNPSHIGAPSSLPCTGEATSLEPAKTRHGAQRNGGGADIGQMIALPSSDARGDSSAQMATVLPGTNTAESVQNVSAADSAPAMIEGNPAIPVLADAPGSRMGASHIKAPGTDAAPTQPAALSAPLGSPEWGRQLGTNISWLVTGQQQSATLTVTPPELGTVTVSLTLSNDVVHAHFGAAEPQVRAALDNAMPQLRDMLQSVGVELGGASVSDGRANSEDRREAAADFARAASSAPSQRSGTAAKDDPYALGTSAVAARPSRTGMIDIFA